MLVKKTKIPAISKVAIAFFTYSGPCPEPSVGGGGVVVVVVLGVDGGGGGGGVEFAAGSLPEPSCLSMSPSPPASISANGPKKRRIC
jgi:hypothetical protein